MVNNNTYYASDRFGGRSCKKTKSKDCDDDETKWDIDEYSWMIPKIIEPKTKGRPKVNLWQIPKNSYRKGILQKQDKLQAGNLKTNHVMEDEKKVEKIWTDENPDTIDSILEYYNVKKDRRKREPE